MECIVHFEVTHKEGVKELRGLIILDEGKTPSEQDFLGMFAEMGYRLRLDDRDKLIFKPVEAGADYSQIRVKSLDAGQENAREDQDLKSVLSNLLPKEPDSF